MYAIIESGAKQYRVEEGDIIDVELLNEEGSTVQFKEVLFLNDGNAAFVGAPYLNCIVKGEIVGTVKGPKLIAYKYKKRKRSRRKVGHRQQYTRVKILEITRGE